MTVGFSPGMLIGKYELGKTLGQGGFGVVMVARDTQLDREVAMKFLHAEHTANPEILRRFLQEARSAAKITHPGIVTVYECGQVSGTNTAADGVAYIAMEMLHGECLSDRLRRSGRLDVDAAVEVSRQIASALESAHRTGIVHRDLKPDNIFLVTDPAMPAGERIKVLDFGIAKLAQPQGTGVQTQSMMVFGTPRYMSPEQCRSAANIDHRSDIYALGCILFELVCGIPPFTGESGELIAKHQLLEPPEPRSLISDLPDHLDRLIQSMLAKQPGDRPQTMAEVQRSLQAGGAMSPGVAPTLLPDADPSASGRQPQAPRSLGRRPGSAPAAPIVDPRERSTANLRPASNPTTLSGAGGVWEPPPSKRRSGLIIAGVALAVIGVGGGWLALRDTSEPATPAQVQAAQPALPPPAPPADAAPAVAKDIELKLTSTPVAEVYLAADGRLLGETPYTHTLPRGTGKIVFLLKAEGHKDARITMAVDKDATEAIVLTANKPVTAAPAEPPSRPARPKSHPKPRTPATNAGSGSAGPAPKPPDDGMGGRI